MFRKPGKARGLAALVSAVAVAGGVVAMVGVESVAHAAPRDDRLALAGVVSRSDLSSGFRATRARALALDGIAGCEAVNTAVSDGAVAQASSRVFRFARTSAFGTRLVDLVAGSSYVFPDATGAASVLAAVDDPQLEGCANGVALAIAADEDRDLLTVESRDAGGNLFPPVIVQDDLLDPEGPGEVDGWFAAFSTVPRGIDQSKLTGLSEEILVHNSVLAAVRVKRAVALVRFDGIGLGAASRPDVEATLTAIAKRLARAQRL
ncbi:MAG: hypothetical protein R6X23_02650 [Acidimicrobiia bacterium]